MSSFLSSSSLSSSFLLPIRIDVTSDDKSFRIVDTFFLDPGVWPQQHRQPQPSVDDGATNRRGAALTLFEPLSLSSIVRGNCRFLAERLLEDSLVMGMGRTARHFTGRLPADTVPRSVQLQVENQIFDQVWAFLNSTSPPKPSESRKRARDTDATNEDLSLGEKAIKKEQETALISIRIRMSAFGVRIHDDFDWDPTVPISPLEIARSIAHDLNLSTELELAVAMDIAEQILSGQLRQKEQERMDQSLASAGMSSFVVDLDPSIKDIRNTTAAWQIDPRAHVSNVAQLVQLHQPLSSAASSSFPANTSATTSLPGGSQVTKTATSSK